MGNKTSANDSTRWDARNEMPPEKWLAAEVKAAIQHGELQYFLQPKHALSNGKLMGFEGLLRWDHPLDGIHGAQVALGAAQAAGLEDEVMLEATRMTLVKARPLPGRFGIAVNVTPEQFGRRAFVDDFIEQVDATAFAPERVTVELTETAPLADPEVARRHAGLLRSAGISIELDDFGAGNNGIRPLCELRGNELLKGIKLDMFYARHYAACSAVRTVTRAVIDLGLEMGLAVTAEGIETPAQARAMLDLGAVFGQGWLWSRALPFDKAVEYLRRNG